MGWGWDAKRLGVPLSHSGIKRQNGTICFLSLQTPKFRVDKPCRGLSPSHALQRHTCHACSVPDGRARHLCAHHRRIIPWMRRRLHLSQTVSGRFQ